MYLSLDEKWDKPPSAESGDCQVEVEGPAWGLLGFTQTYSSGLGVSYLNGGLNPFEKY